jgi:PIN domain nuclease of toxin-antitoxin system
VRPLLLDTHVALWSLADVERLGPRARASMTARAGEVLVSVASVWEVAIKQSIGKLAAPDDLWDQAESNGLRIVDITRADAEGVRSLPPHHRDPFDRLLVAQARRLGAELVTADPRLGLYDVDIIAAGE